jgi:hypothetical protein
LVDPLGVADLCATHEDHIIPSSCFTAPDTLGFSRGFVRDPKEMMRVFQFPKKYIRMNYVKAWMDVLEVDPVPVEKGCPKSLNRPEGSKIHVNEVVRAAVNRKPHKICIAMQEVIAEEELKPLLMLCRARDIPVVFQSDCVSGAIATVYFRNS